MRLDKLLVSLNIGSRSEVKKYILKGLIKVNGTVIKKTDEKVDENSVLIEFEGREYKYVQYRYFLMNKPSGVICATSDVKERTVIDIFNEKTEFQFKEEYFPVGRLDKDTVGLLLITNDGMLAHKLLSPKNHVKKTYFVRLKRPLSKSDIDIIENGVRFKDFTSMNSKIFDLQNNNTECKISICEGKYHEVKRLFLHVDNEVTYLKRTDFGPLVLNADLAEGEIRPLSIEEVEDLINV